MIDTAAGEIVDAEFKVQRTFRSSGPIPNLLGALAKAQGQIEGAKKDSDNPFFKSKYADLASVWDAIRKALSANEIAVIQFPRATAHGVEIETLLGHSSGEWVAETLELPLGNKHDAQGVGSALTYARRYGLSSITGVAPEDDDGNAAAQAASKNGAKKYDSTPVGRSRLAAETLHDLEAAAELGTESLRVGWESISPSLKKELAGEKDRLKELASKRETEAAGAGR